MTRNEAVRERLLTIAGLIQAGMCDVLAWAEDDGGFSVKVSVREEAAPQACAAGTPGCTGAVKQLTGGRQGCGRCGQEVSRG